MEDIMEISARVYWDFFETIFSSKKCDMDGESENA